MRNTSLAALLAGLAVVAACLLWPRPHRQPDTLLTRSTSTARLEPVASAPALKADAELPASAQSALTPPPNPTPARTPAAVEPLTPELATLPEETVLENMRSVVRLYGSTFGGNPVGTNQEITRALQGDNPRRINFLKADGNRVNSAGELVDVWGTPYFFHQLSATQMEIRSAGPDKIMYTADDVVIE